MRFFSEKSPRKNGQSLSQQFFSRYWLMSAVWLMWSDYPGLKSHPLFLKFFLKPIFLPLVRWNCFYCKTWGKKTQFWLFVHLFFTQNFQICFLSLKLPPSLSLLNDKQFFGGRGGGESCKRIVFLSTRCCLSLLINLLVFPATKMSILRSFPWYQCRPKFPSTPTNCRTLSYKLSVDSTQCYY